MKPAAIDRRELAGLGALLILAAVVRFVALPAAGPGTRTRATTC